MMDVHVIEEPAAAAVALDPLRSRLLYELREPASAATLAGRVGLPRQKLNYHVRTPEAHGLVRVVAALAGYKAVHSLGYDLEQNQFAGYWIDSFLNFPWELAGTFDDASQELTMATRGPAPAGGTAAFRERYQFNSADAITILGEMQHGEHWVGLTATRLTRIR